MVLRKFLGVEPLDSIGTCLLPGLKKRGEGGIGRNGKDGMDVVGHNDKAVAEGALGFKASLQDLHDNGSRPLRRQELAPLISGESHKMKLSRQINDLAFGHLIASCRLRRPGQQVARTTRSCRISIVTFHGFKSGNLRTMARISIPYFSLSSTESSSDFVASMRN